MNAETVGALSIFMAMIASVVGFISIQRHGASTAELSAKLAHAAGVDPAHAATKSLYDIMALALDQQTARADAQAKRIAELEAQLYNQSDLLRTLQLDRDATYNMLRGRNDELNVVREEATRLKLRVQELEPLAARVQELEHVAAQVEQMRHERDRAIKTAEEAKIEADALRGRVATLEQRLAILEGHGE